MRFMVELTPSVEELIQLKGVAAAAASTSSTVSPLVLDPPTIVGPTVSQTVSSAISSAIPPTSTATATATTTAAAIVTPAMDTTSLQLPPPALAVPSGVLSPTLSNTRKMAAARREKQLADLMLLRGLPAAAHALYTNACKPLRECSDWLWLGSAFEGMAVCAQQLVAEHDPTVKATDVVLRFREAVAAYGHAKDGTVFKLEALLRLGAHLLATGQRADIPRELAFVWRWCCLSFLLLR
jgi:hypothetical protein